MPNMKLWLITNLNAYNCSRVMGYIEETFHVRPAFFRENKQEFRKILKNGIR